MTPAQDATALADELAQISGRCSYERDRETIIKAVAALRATSQTPDAVRIASDFWMTISPDKEILRANVRAIGQNIADAITNALRPTPSASAGPQAEAVQLRTLFLDHYWDSLEDRKSIVMKHIDFVLSIARAEQVDETDAELAQQIHKVAGCQVGSRRNARLIKWYRSKQPQQADGRGAVIEALEHITELLVDTWATTMPGDPEKEIAVFNARAALQQSPATDGPAK